MDVITALLVILLVWALSCVIKAEKGKSDEPLKSIHGPPRVPLFGNLLAVMIPTERRIDLVRYWDKTYGPLYKTWMGPSLPHLHVTNANLAGVVFSSTEYNKKGCFYRLLRPWLGTGLITGSGDKWAKHRRILTPSFFFGVLNNYVHIFNDNSKILTGILEKKAETEGSLDVYQYVALCALDILSESTLGTKINAQIEQDSEYVKAVHRLSGLTLQRAIQLWTHYDRIFFVTKIGRETLKVAKLVHEFAENVIRERRKVLEPEDMDDKDEDGVKQKKSFLDIMIKLGMSDEDIRQEVDTFMFAGHDTTTAGISWALFLLGNHPEIQEQAFEEQCDIFSDDLLQPATMADLHKMKLLERIIKETLRLYPSVPYISRQPEQDVVLDSHIIPKKTQVCVHIISIHRDPKFYPDPDKFDPDRFLPENTINRHPFAYVPFSAGSRNCIGQKFAMLEMKTVLSTLLRNLKFESIHTIENVKPIFETILRPKDGIVTKITRRNCIQKEL